MRRLILKDSPVMVNSHPQEIPVASGPSLFQGQNLKGKKDDENEMFQSRDIQATRAV